MVSTSPPSLQQSRQQREPEELLRPTIRSSRTQATMAKDGQEQRQKLLYKLGFEKSGALVGAPPSVREPSRGSLLGRVQTSTEPLKYDENFDKVMLEKKQRALERRASRSPSGVFSALGALFISPPPETASRDDTESPFKPSSLTSVNTATSSSADESSPSSGGSSSDGSKNEKRRRGLTFNDHVTVVPIPKREEYSKRIRDRLWVNARDLQSQAARNAVEFASEGWDWRNAYTDEEMYVCAATGEKVHPVHCETDD